MAGDRRFWLAYPTRDADGLLIDAATGVGLDRLSGDLARVAGESVVNGLAPDETDVHISQTSGEVVQRRPAIWRAFGPFLAYHTFGFTGNPWFDTALLTALQLTVLAMVVSGWRLALTGRSRS